jgi:RNA polymerase sigma-70 factor (ECF subfamily)
MENEDKELVEEYISGNESAFNKLVNKYQNRIYWHARKMMGNHEDADEITQEVLIILYQKLHTFNFNSSLFTWIFKIISRRSINLINKKKIKNFFSLSDENIEVTENYDMIKNIDDKEKLRKLDLILQTLPARQREVFLLRHFEELSYDEISKITGKSVGGLKANYFHALNKVLEKFKNEE